MSCCVKKMLKKNILILDYGKRELGSANDLWGLFGVGAH